MTVLAATAFALSLGVVWLRRRRDRIVLRQALHELRRPLQALMLERSPGRAAVLAQLRVALADLEDAVEGRVPRRRIRERMTVADLLADARERWRDAPVALVGRLAADAELEGDRVRLGMALDNLIANGLEHGSGEVSVVSGGDRGRVRLEVVNGGRSSPGSTGAGERTPRGQGLRIAARNLAADSGHLERPRRRGEAVVAAVELPRSGPGPGPTAA